MQASGGNPFATAFPKRESEDALLFENRLKNFGMKSEGFNNMSNIFDDFQFSSGGHSVGASLLVKRPDDLSSKGMMSKLSGSDSATVISSIPSSSDSKAASERISLASSSPSRTQARALL